MTIKYQILQGDNRTTLKSLPDNSIDAIVTDPPYGIDFLGKSWDANTGALETYQECLRVLKPGGHILAFSAARTYHHLAVTLEQAGFEIRDQIMWIYSSGFPKSQDIGKSIQRSLGVKETKTTKGGARPSDLMVHAYAEENEYTQPVLTDPLAKQWSGWGTQLKPAHEPIALARKPIKLSIAQNCQAHGVGALNIDATRVPYDDPAEAAADAAWRAKWSKHNVAGPVFQDQDIEQVRKKQKKPIGGVGNKATHKNFSAENTDKETTDIEIWEPSQLGRFPSNVVGEIPDYQKYFYCPKVSRRERHIGHTLPDAEPLNSPDQVRNHPLWEPSIGTNAHRLKEKIRTEAAKDKIKTGLVDKNGNTQTFTSDPATHNIGNNHPTVKPIELMKYLISLITPPGGTVLDPFNGSGSTGCAAVELGHEYIGCELDPAYVEIANKRIQAWYKHCNPTTFNRLFEVE